MKTNANLIDEIKKALTGDLETLCVNLLLKPRDTNILNSDFASMLAARLFEAGEGRLGTDEEEFIKVFSSYSTAQLQEIGRIYREMHEHTLERAVADEFIGTLELGLIDM